MGGRGRAEAEGADIICVDPMMCDPRFRGLLPEEFALSTPFGELMVDFTLTVSKRNPKMSLVEQNGGTSHCGQKKQSMGTMNVGRTHSSRLIMFCVLFELSPN